MKTLFKLIVLIVVLIIVVFDLAGAPLACDTPAFLAGATARGIVLFGKNNNRLLFDCHLLMLHPRAPWPAGTSLGNDCYLSSRGLGERPLGSRLPARTCSPTFYSSFTEFIDVGGYGQGKPFKTVASLQDR